MAVTQCWVEPPGEARRRGFAALAGLFLGLGLLKFGNPAVVEALVTPPRDAWELLFMPWPLAWGYVGLAVLVLGALGAARWRRPPAGVVFWLPAVWLGWQWVAATGTVDARLTRLHLPYFASVAAGFYLGWLALAPATQLRVFWAALTGCFAAVLVVGFQQHFGGLEEVRRQVLSQPGAEQLPADYLRRLATGRIFATLVYPNALAGAILLLLPALTVAVWQGIGGAGGRRGVGALAAAVLACGGLACLYWTRSKSGWLIALGLGVVLGWRGLKDWRWKAALAVAVLGVGLGVFAVRFGDYFQQGAASWGARMEYWRASWSTLVRHPLLGGGPGTFATQYRAVKPPEAEMTRLAHNDYLQQAGDSGLPGALAYAGFWVGTLVVTSRRVGGDPLRLAVWLGLLGWALQGGVEFALYVPGAAWAAFWLAGWLWGVTVPERAEQGGVGAVSATLPAGSRVS